MTAATVMPAAARATRSRSALLLLVLAAVAAMAMLPIAAANTPFVVTLATRALVASLVALSLDLLVGSTGLLSFGHAGWYGFGAYAAGLIAKHVSPELLIVLPLSMLATALAAAAIGGILTKQIGKTFAILTLALSQIFYSLIFVAAKWTGGEDGLQGIPIPTLAGVPVASLAAGYWLVLAILVTALGAAFYVRETPLGRAWRAIKDNTERAQFIGIDTARLKLLSFVVSAALAAVAGSLSAVLSGATSPDILHWFESGKMLMYVILGGVGTLIGPVIGAVLFTVAEHYVSSFTSAWLIYFGGLFVLIVVVAPGGLVGLLVGLRRWLGRSAPT